jgi:trehalose 6-phosphate synthase
MSKFYAVMGGVAFLIAILFGFFTATEVSQEKLDLTLRLQSRTQVLVDSLAENVEGPYLRHATSTVQAVTDRFVDGARVVGLAVLDTSGEQIASSSSVTLPVDQHELDALGSAEPEGWFVPQDGKTYYVFAAPLQDSSQSVIGTLLLVQDATYIDDQIAEVWRDNLLRFLAVLLFVIGGFYVLIRLVFARSVASFALQLRQVRAGDEAPSFGSDHRIFQPLVSEMQSVVRSLGRARERASEEARLRFERLESPWTAERLQEFMRAYAKNKKVYVLSNREPYTHFHKKGGGIGVEPPSHGMITALDELMQACGGTWVAHGAGNADREVVDLGDKVDVPTDEPRYKLRRVWLTDEEIKGHYVGFSNEALFPLCLMSHNRPVFRPDDWAAYKQVNAKFADALLEEIRGVEQPLVLVQDLHFALVPRIIKRRRPDAQVALFWHHPWPSAEQFSICPWRVEILDGMLGADVIGFHIQQYCNNFLDTIGKEVEARLDFEHFAAVSGGHASLIRPFPMSVSFTGARKRTRAQKPGQALAKLGVHTPSVVLGVDRLDYTKGILERLRGVELFFDRYPERRKQVTFLQIAAPSREAVKKHREYGDEVAREVERINGRLQSASWKPVVFVRRHLTREELRPLYREAGICLVTPLHDGMNLVAKEYIAERESSGVLVLSEFTGASRDLTAAIIVNPYSPESISDALDQALSMPLSEQYRRMKSLQESVSSYNAYRWGMELIRALVQSGSYKRA